MPDDCDAKSGKCFTLGELAKLSGAELKGNPEVRIEGVSTLEDAGPKQLTFLTHSRYLGYLPQCRAAAVVVAPAFRELDFPLLICDQPYLALARVAQLFSEPPPLAGGVHERAYIGDEVRIDETVSIGALAHVGAHCRIGRSTRIYGNAYLGAGVQIGEECLIYPGVAILDRCRIGNRVIIHSGTVIGSDGYGFAQDEKGRHVKIPQGGIVEIGDDVEIGANCAIDRATFGSTVIGRGTKIDNLVQIGHNVTVGEHSLLVGQVVISGSTRIGSHVILAGQVGIVGHVEIGDRVRVGAKSGVHHSVKAGEDISGYPAVPYKEWLKTMANLRRLSQFKEELRQLKAKVRELEEALHGE
jgi:UDP-3-O-[3-hydroxymyristoyl] glucosamine N-acyltransferase